MNKEIDIFDLDVLEDIPDELRKSIKLKGVGFSTEPILRLFDIKEVLSIDEIIVGLYRLHKVKKTRQWVSSNLYNLKRSGLIEKIQDGSYRILK